MFRILTILVVLIVVIFVVALFYLDMNFLVSIGLVYVTAVASQPISDNDSLRLISVFLRHGARTPEFKDTYPNDPYKLDTFQPMGWGQLTNHGKEMAFTLGKSLRKRYQEFLGDIYTPEAILAQSTDYDRTKMSALLALAGLYPPAETQRWNDQLNWLPIPFEYDKDKLDHSLKRPNTYCPRYMKELEEVLQSDAALAYLKPIRITFRYIENHCGKPINKLSDVFQIYQTLTAERSMNLTLPDWTVPVYPDVITRMAAKQCEMENYNDILKRLNGGRMLGKVIANMVAKTEGSLHPHERKIFIYSGHENNVINILAAMDLYKTHFPNYSSAVLIELHYLRSRQNYAVKVLYQGDVYNPPEELALPNCDVLCPLDSFIKLTENHVPKNYTAECDALVNLD
ncbi:venom acid phosphatase Acph-1 isoform X1 [Dendroctonus ponderosae]|uniref:acid phosphatase n=1 Tax=Dendroctonus ponderosae TaxID=77166 RepID=J3JZ60_DENPD